MPTKSSSIAATTTTTTTSATAAALPSAKKPVDVGAMSYSCAVAKTINMKSSASSSSSSSSSSAVSSAFSSASSIFSSNSLSSRESSPIASTKCRKSSLSSAMANNEEVTNNSNSNNNNNKNQNNRNKKCHPLPSSALASVLDSGEGTDDVDQVAQWTNKQQPQRRWKRNSRCSAQAPKSQQAGQQQQQQKRQQLEKVPKQFARRFPSHRQQPPPSPTAAPASPASVCAATAAAPHGSPSSSSSSKFTSLLSLLSSASSSSGIGSCAGTETPPGTNTPHSLVAPSPEVELPVDEAHCLPIDCQQHQQQQQQLDEQREFHQQKNAELLSELLGWVQLQQQQQMPIPPWPMPLMAAQPVPQQQQQLSFVPPPFPPSSAASLPLLPPPLASSAALSPRPLFFTPSSPCCCCCCDQQFDYSSPFCQQQQQQSSPPPASPPSLIPSPAAGLLLDLSHPVVCQFYLQQRHFFRQIYAQQLAALSARLGLTPPPERLITSAPTTTTRQQQPLPRRDTVIATRQQMSPAIAAAVQPDVPSPSPPPPPHQHLGFPPAPPPPGQLIQWLGPAAAWPQSPQLQQQMPSFTISPSSPPMAEMAGNTSCSLDFYQISCMDVLSEHIFNFKQNTEQSSTELNRKLILRDQLYYAISPIFPMCGLYIVGSSLNGFGTKHSDLDLCLMITNRDIDQRSDAVVVLSSVFRTLENFSLVVDQQLILAKVPILRIKCSGAFEGIVVDLNVNNSVAIRNTHLMSYYSGFDWRVRPIVMVVKEWAKCRGINNASHSSFTSYSLALMVIHYLQCGANPPVLPSLQKIYPNRFSEKTDVRLLNISQPLEPMPSAVWNFDQRLTLSELLLGFLQYYAYDFNFDHDAISIRTGRKVNRAQVAQNQSPFNTLSQWHCICIEEPFTLSNAAHSIYDQRIFNYIKESFTKSYIELDKHRDLDQFLAKPTGDEELRLVMPLPQEIMIIPNDKVENTPTNHANYCL